MNFSPASARDLSTDIPMLVPASVLSATSDLSAAARHSASLLFIDGGVQDYSQLVAGVAAGTEVHILDPVQDAVTQITQALLGQSGISSLHIVSHGEAGGLDFGGSRLNLGDLPGYAAQLQSWSQALTDDADILLYGCDVASGELGQAFVQMLGQLTGADVAASDDLTGSSALGGDWTLEFSTGSIESGLAFGQSVRDAYTSILPTFAAATTFGVGTTPISVATADFNGDGIADIVSANSISNTVSVLLGTGTGGFSAKTDFTVGTAPYSVAVADFNGDSKADIVAANLNADTISVLLGTGTGSFGAKTDFTSAPRPYAIAIGDFNGDGKADIVTTANSANYVSVQLGTGTGSFGAVSNFTVGTGPVSLAVGDFNGDGRADIAVANFNSNNVSVLLGTGTGSFGAKTDFTVGTNARSVAIGDFNGDSIADIVVANNGSTTVSVLLGTGTGSFGAATPFTVGSGPISVAVADLNSDGKADIVAANYTSNTVSVLLGTGTGSFGPKTDFAVGGTNLFSVAIADFNGDGKADIATANAASNNVSVLLNTSPVVVLPIATAAYTEDSTPISIAPLASFTDGIANLTGGTLTASLTAGGSADDRLSILTTGGITLNGRVVSYLGNAIGTTNQVGGYGSSNPLVISLNTIFATPVAVQALLRAINFSNTSQNPSTAARTLSLTVNDGTTLSNTATQTITVTATPDAPIIGIPTTLYTPNGTSPGTQGWVAAILPGATETPIAGSVNLNTTLSAALYSGYGRIDIPLDRTVGYTLNFTAQLPISTTAASAEKNGDSLPDRAGFSVILVNSDLKAIELGFLANSIFAQEDGTRQTTPSVQASTGSPTSTLFTQGESVTYNTATQTNYSLTVQGNTYTLSANGTAILTGNLRDYSAAPSTPPLPNPYIVPNTIFFGDDTTSASASVNLGAISITGAAPIALTVLEDTPIAAPSLDLSGLNLTGSITATLTSTLGSITVNTTILGGVPSSNITNNGSGTVTLTGSFSQLNALLIGGGLTYQGNPNVNGSDALTLTVNGTGLPTGPLSKTIPITIAPVNDRPSFIPGANQIVTAGAGAQSIANFASFNPGPTDEVGQTATYTIVNNSNPNLFATQPTIAPNGTLVYTPVSTLTTAQTATITLQVQDNGGTANGGIDTSTTQSFTITVNPIATPPVVTPPVVTPPVVTPPVVIPPVGPPLTPVPSTVIPIFTVFQLRQTFTLNITTQKLLAAQPSNTLQQLFDEEFYLRQNPDVYAAYAKGVFQSGFQHFLQYGQYEGRNPSGLFNEQYYLSQNLDVSIAISRGSFRSGFQHFLQFGQYEGRNFCTAYSEQTYLSQNQDVSIAISRGSFRSGFQHFLQYGFAEGRLPNLTLFNEQYYLSQNPDVAAAVARGQFKNGLQHFEQYGQREGRKPSPLFDERYYLRQNPDVAAAVAQGKFKSGFDHYLDFGRFEGRSGIG